MKDLIISPNKQQQGELIEVMVWQIK